MKLAPRVQKTRNSDRTSGNRKIVLYFSLFLEMIEKKYRTSSDDCYLYEANSVYSNSSRENFQKIQLFSLQVKKSLL